MKWKTHKLITRAVCEALSIPNSEEVVESSVFPDQHNEFFVSNGKRVRIKHHSPFALKAAWRHILKARKLLLQGKDCSEDLGMALHYIQDYSVSVTRRFLFFRWRSEKVHDEREEELAELPVPRDAIEEGMKIRDPNQLKKALFSEKPEEELERIMYTATTLSAAAVATIFYPVGDGSGWRRAVALHIAAVASPLLLALIGGWLWLPLATVLGYAVHKLDFKYHRAKLERDWFRP
ncbi:hypothetical protein Ferp_0572 [Ferroglobus placidus DSM 10642]|uniref:Phospholipase C/D domain-containing protein n=1 Tax=Ferroglobus placidus (strain DSM 10642 / AEDII12DO) TaxID=589924 RepID=D3S3B2_FERPA|nr:hypothetical protein Ferp_0572 [Ferroglobus placidus DSM 10642]